MRTIRTAHAGDVVCLVIALVLMVGNDDSQARDFRVSEVTRNSDSSVSLRFPSTDTAYFILERGSDLESFPDTVAMVLGIAGEGVLVDAMAPSDRATFYRVKQFSRSSPVDTDGDGIDDVYELERALVLDPLNRADASEDPDGNGLTHLEEFLQGSRRLTQISTSPRGGEEAVALTRETIVRFDRPLASDTVLNTSQLFAEFGGRRLPGRLEVAELTEPIDGWI